MATTPLSSPSCAFQVKVTKDSLHTAERIPRTANSRCSGVTSGDSCLGRSRSAQAEYVVEKTDKPSCAGASVAPRSRPPCRRLGFRGQGSRRAREIALPSASPSDGALRWRARPRASLLPVSAQRAEHDAKPKSCPYGADLPRCKSLNAAAHAPPSDRRALVRFDCPRTQSAARRYSQ